MNKVKEEILSAIGLGMGDAIFEGRSSAVLVRMIAASRLEGVIRRLSDYGEPIAPPNVQMMQLVYYVVRNGELRNDSIQESYRVICRVIDEHLRVHDKTPYLQERAFEFLYEELAASLGRRRAQHKQEHQSFVNQLWADMIH